MKFITKCETRMEDYDCYGNMTLKAVLQLFENVASYQSDTLDESIIDNSLNGIAWILTEWRVEMIKDIPYKKEYTVETWSKGTLNALLVDRDYQLLDEDGEILAKGEASFVLLDMETQKPMRITDELMEKYQPEMIDVWEGKKFARMREAKTYDFEKEINLRRTDIDFNHHVHNLTYIDYIMEMLPENRYEKKIKKLRINYRKGIEAGERIIGKYHLASDKEKIGFYGSSNEGKISTMVDFWME